MRTIHNLALIGFMGVGKSSVGHLVAAQLQFTWVDTDDLIERRAGKPVARIFAEDGEAHFRALEAEVVQGLGHQRHLVIATGGGLVAHSDNLARLKAHALVVCLWATPETIWERVHHQSHRPLLQVPNPLERIRELLAQREPFYRQADVLIISDGRHAREVAQHVLQHYHAVTDPKDGPGGSH